MKKSLLLTAMMAAAMTASAQTDFKVTLLNSLPVSQISNYNKAYSRTGYGYGDKFYMVDRAAQQLRVFSLANNSEWGQVEIGNNQATGHDEAGNAIVGNWGFAGSNAAGKKTTFTLISADLSKTVTTNEVTYVTGRCDFLGKAKGNVFGSEGATLLAKRLLDYGYHAPTIYFPLLFHESLMIEPTENESKDTINGFVEVMRKIAEEARTNPDIVKSAPHNTPIGRVDDVLAAKHPVVKFKDIEV